MIKQNVVVQNPSGLHARPGSDFVQRASRFKSKITLRRLNEEDVYNAKSIVMLLAIGLAQGEEAELTATGEDEKEAVESLVHLIEHELKD